MYAGFEHVDAPEVRDRNGVSDHEDTKAGEVYGTRSWSRQEGNEADRRLDERYDAYRKNALDLVEIHYIRPWSLSRGLRTVALVAVVQRVRTGRCRHGV